MECKVRKYVKKPVVVEAIQWNGYNWQDITSFCGDSVTFEVIQRQISDDVFTSITFLHIKTLEGDMEARVGDYIIKGVKGEFYPCKPDIFDKTYQEV